MYGNRWENRLCEPSVKLALDMSVTVLVINWNSRELLEKCLQHLTVQVVPPTQILVIDNASSDDLSTVTEKFSNTDVIKTTSNLGFAGANNMAIAKCTTDFVALLNPDAFPAPEWLERLLVFARLHPEIVAFGSRQVSWSNPEVLDGSGDTYNFTGLVWRTSYGKTQNAQDLVPREIFSPCAAAALYRRDAIVDVGGFDEDYFCYLEDVDLGFRLRLAGHRAMYVPDAVVRHVGSATTGGSQSDFAIYHGHRNLVWTFVKNMPGLLFWLLLPFHVAMNLLSVGIFVFRGRGKVIVRAKWDAIRGVSKMWRKRQTIQSRRVASIKDIWRVIDKQLLLRSNRR